MCGEKSNPFFSTDGWFCSSHVWNIFGLLQKDLFSPLGLESVLWVTVSSANSLQLSVLSPPTLCWDDYVLLHRDWSSDRCSFRFRQRTGVLGCCDQHHSEERHQLFSGISGCGWYSRRVPRHPLCHNHQHRHTPGLLWMSLPCLFCPGAHSEFHL